MTTAVESLELAQPRVRLGSPVAVELPHVPDLANLVEVELRRNQLVAIPARLCQNLSPRIAEVALPVELADVPRLLESDAIDRTDEIRVGHRVRGLLQLPQILRQSRHRRRWVEHDFRAIEPELARALGEVAVVTDVDAHIGVLRLEHRVSEIAGLEIELFPESRRTVRDVALSVFPEILSVGIDHGRRIVIHASLVFLIEWRDDHHRVSLRNLLHQTRRRPIRNLLHRIVPPDALLGAKIRALSLIHISEPTR